MKHSRELVIVAIATISIVAAGCAKKKVATATPPSPPAVTAPAQQNAPAPQSASAMPAPTETTPPSRYPDAATRKRIDELLARIEDAYFDYNKAALRPDAVTTLRSDSEELRDILKDYPDYKLTIEGHCDERGSAEYNMALGEKRAESAKNYLVQVGIPSDQLHVISYGKEQAEHCTDDSCWQKDRKIHIVAMNQQ